MIVLWETAGFFGWRREVQRVVIFLLFLDLVLITEAIV